MKHIQPITSAEADRGRWRSIVHPNTDEVELLAGFNRLSTIEVVYRFVGSSFQLRDADQIAAEAVAVLKQSRQKGAKYARLRVIQANSSVFWGHTIRTDTVKVSEV